MTERSRCSAPVSEGSNLRSTKLSRVVSMTVKSGRPSPGSMMNGTAGSKRTTSAGGDAVMGVGVGVGEVEAVRMAAFALIKRRFLTLGTSFLDTDATSERACSGLVSNVVNPGFYYWLVFWEVGHDRRYFAEIFEYFKPVKFNLIT